MMATPAAKSAASSAGVFGILDFVVLETEAKDDRGDTVFFSRNLLISRRA